MGLVARPRALQFSVRSSRLRFFILKNGGKLSSTIVLHDWFTAAKNCHAVAIGTVPGDAERQLSGADVHSQSASLS